MEFQSKNQMKIHFIISFNAFLAFFVVFFFHFLKALFGKNRNSKAPSISISNKFAQFLAFSCILFYFSWLHRSQFLLNSPIFPSSLCFSFDFLKMFITFHQLSDQFLIDCCCCCFINFQICSLTFSDFSRFSFYFIEMFRFPK